MKTIPWITITLVGFMSIMLWRQASQLADIRSDLALLKEALKGGLDAGTTVAPAPAEIKLPSDIDKRISEVPPDDSEAYAKALAEVDEWVFHPDDGEVVSNKLQKLVSSLQDKLKADIQRHLSTAIQAASGKEASASISKAGVLFGLFPQPSTEIEKRQVEMLSDEVSAAARRVDEIRRLRYNEWASSQIQLAFTGYHSKKQSFGDDDDDLIRAFVANLGEVDTSYLEPAVSGIYQQILSLTTDAVAESKKVELAQKLSSPASKRKTPLDF
jgi:hypothetical protein